MKRNKTKTKNQLSPEGDSSSGETMENDKDKKSPEKVEKSGFSIFKKKKRKESVSSSDDQSSKGSKKGGPAWKTVIQKIHTVIHHWGYLIPYWIMYVYLMINDSVKLFFFPKFMDLPINILTFLVLIWFVADLILRCFTDKGYFLRFFFFADIACLVFIVASAIIEIISLWILFSFLKILMVLKITSLIQAYKEWRRRLKFRSKMRKERAQRQNANSSILGKGGILAAPKKSIFGNLKRRLTWKKDALEEPPKSSVYNSR